jgi:hypothetical protein
MSIQLVIFSLLDPMTGTTLYASLSAIPRPPVTTEVRNAQGRKLELSPGLYLVKP